jgi:glycosyltransferase involved in cell wall biosynthesis
MRFLSESSIFLGASKSDGISTTFLEALVSGCYAIQTNTSCANEWLDRGFIASIVETNSESIYNEIKRVIDNELLRIQAYDTNIGLAREQLDYNTIAQIALSFYKK